MRLKLTLLQKRKVESLPLNANYYISAAIYRTLEQSSPDFATVMHHYGYSSPDERRKFKLFTFSNLDVPERHIDKERQRLISRSKTISFTLSSPMDDFLTHLVSGLFADNNFRIDEAIFEKGAVETLPDPEFKETMEFSMLSPLTVSVMRPDRTKEFLKYNDERLPLVLLQNLKAKYQAVYRTEFQGEVNDFRVAFSERYIERQNGKIEKLITLKEGREEETKVKGILCPFTISAPMELIKVGYECGFGERNSQGFGMVKQ